MALNCCDTLNGGISITCDTNTGGAVRMWLTNSCNVSVTKGSATDSPSTEGTVIALTMAANTHFWEFQGLRNSIGFEESATINNETGSTFYAPRVTITIPRREVAKRNKLRLLANQRMVIVVEDRNGYFWVCGIQDGMLLEELSGGVGTTPDSLNGYVLAFTGQEADMAHTIDWATFEPTIG